MDTGHVRFHLISAQSDEWVSARFRAHDSGTATQTSRNGESDIEPSCLAAPGAFIKTALIYMQAGIKIPEQVQLNRSKWVSKMILFVDVRPS